MKANLHLLIIDPQNDFCDLPPDYCPFLPGNGGRPYQPSLPVAGAHEDLLRLADVLHQGMDGISGITVTLDSHHRLDIAHPTFWLRHDGMEVSPFTQISLADLEAGRYHTRDPAAMGRAVHYVEALEAGGRYQLMIWPIHCEIGSYGHNVHAAIREAYNRWEDSARGVVRKVHKGSNPWTEHYSALRAEVIDPDDPGTHLNRRLLDDLALADLIIVAGEAASHCVKSTVEHLVEHLPPSSRAKLVLVTDCMSPVMGFAPQFTTFLEQMRQAGVALAKAEDIVRELQANGRK